MLSLEALRALPAREYLDHFQLDFYLRDALSQFLSRSTAGKRESRSASDFFARYFDAVLRGEHLLGCGYRYMAATPFNRRSFVRLLREGLSGVAEPGCTAVMPLDFHDLVVRLCPDFPAALVLEAAEHAELDTASRRWRLLGSSTPAPLGGTAAEARAAGSAAMAGGRRLCAFDLLQRLVEVSFVYSELVFVMARIFAEDACLGRVSRTTLVSELRRGGRALSGAALPSERQLLRLLAPVAADARAEEELISYGEALAEMAVHFELLPATFVAGVRHADLAAAASPGAAASLGSAADGSGAASPEVL